MKKFFISGQTLFGLLFCLSFCLWTALMPTAESAEKQTQEKWRLDAMQGAVLPRSLRFMTDEFTVSVEPLPPRAGLDALRCSASAEFSGRGLPLIKEKILAHAGQDAVIYIVDLRKESHGFVNGDIPVSSYAKRNWGNRGLSTAEVSQAEEKLLRSIVGRKLTFVPKGGTDTKILTECTTKVEQAETESSIAAKNGMRYKRIAVTDQAAPTAENIDEFMAFYAQLPPKAWLHFHCHAGHGRTTSFVVFYDILRNPDMTLEDIAARQYALGGTDLLHPDEKKAWKIEEARKRAEQIRKFYAYVQAERGANFNRTFSQWIQEQE